MAPVPFLRPGRWQADSQGTRAAQLHLHKRSAFSWGTSPSLEIVSNIRLFRSPWFGCFYRCSRGLQWSCSTVSSIRSYETKKGGVTWVRAFLECLSQILDLGQRVVPAKVHLPRAADGGSSAPAAPPAGWGHLWGEASPGVGWPFCSAWNGTRQGQANQRQQQLTDCR